MKRSVKYRNVIPRTYSLKFMNTDLETIMQFDHLSSVQDFIENVIPEMLTENFIPRAELRETTMAILNRRSR